MTILLFFQFRVRQVATPLLTESSPQLVSLAVREVASYFPGLSNCESDVIQFLTKKIKGFLKQHKYRNNLKKKENENAKNLNAVVVEVQKESDLDPSEFEPELDGESTVTQSVSSDIHPPQEPQPSMKKVIEVQKESDLDPFEFEPELDGESTVTQSVSSDIHPPQEPQPSMKKNAKPVPRKKPALKRALPESKSEGHVKANSPPKPKKSKTPNPVLSVDHANDSVMPREFSSNNPQNVKFQEGDFVVLGEDVDKYHFCKIDKIDYDKQSTKYFMNVTYHELIDGRLEECLKPKTTKIWHAKRVPLNTVILNLRYTRLVDNDMKSRISAITNELYS